MSERGLNNDESEQGSPTAVEGDAWNGKILGVKREALGLVECDGRAVANVLEVPDFAHSFSEQSDVLLRKAGSNPVPP
jgi:hypothetical protein